MRAVVVGRQQRAGSLPVSVWPRRAMVQAHAPKSKTSGDPIGPLSRSSPRATTFVLRALAQSIPSHASPHTDPRACPQVTQLQPGSPTKPGSSLSLTHSGVRNAERRPSPPCWRRCVRVLPMSARSGTNFLVVHVQRELASRPSSPRFVVAGSRSFSCRRLRRRHPPRRADADEPPPGASLVFGMLLPPAGLLPFTVYQADLCLERSARPPRGHHS